MKDFGYDISDHTDVEPMFGTLDDADALIAAAHERGLRLLLDFVPNHTSDEHPWFREHPEYYRWADEPPNNWISVFGGPGWTLDPERGRFYYHAYLREQPDLDWRNPELREAMLGVLRFWLDRGVDGFRVDALRQVLKDPELRDNPPNPDYRDGPAGVRPAAAGPQRRPRRPRAGARDGGDDRRARRRDGRRAVRAARAARPLLRRRACRCRRTCT